MALVEEPARDGGIGDAQACTQQALGVGDPHLDSTGTQVFFMTFLGFYLLKERPSANFLVSITLAFIGLYLLLMPEMSSALGMKGVIYGVLSGLAYAVCVYFLKVNTQLPDGGGDKIAQMLNLSLWAALVLLGYPPETPRTGMPPVSLRCALTLFSQPSD
ncbi:hypothetical protein PSN_3778 [Pseudomonas sp. NGC7]